MTPPILKKLSALTAVVLAAAITSSAQADPAILSVSQSGTIVDPNLPLVTSAGSPYTVGTGAQGALGDEAFYSVTRSGEYTAVRTLDSTGLLTNSTTAGTTLQLFPAYLAGLEYVQIANNNRSVVNYNIDMTFASDVTAYLFVDNRVNGSTNKATITTDPTFSGNTQWVIDDGWTRVNTGFMPNGQADYIGYDEGNTVASPDLRSHSATGLIAGSGNGLNNYAAIYSKNFTAGFNAGVGKAYGIGTSNFYGIAVVAVPEPSSLALCLAGGVFAIGRMRRRATR